MIVVFFVFTCCIAASVSMPKHRDYKVTTAASSYRASTAAAWTAEAEGPRERIVGLATGWDNWIRVHIPRHHASFCHNDLPVSVLCFRRHYSIGRSNRWSWAGWNRCCLSSLLNGLVATSVGSDRPCGWKDQKRGCPHWRIRFRFR